MIEIRHDRYRFDEAEHVHYVDDEPVAGVTSVCGVLDKPALMGWGIWKALSKVKSSFLASPEDYMTKDSFGQLLDEAQAEPERIKVEAGIFGTMVHKMVEDFNLGNLVPKSISRRANTLFNFYCKWFEENKVQVIAAEANLFSGERKVGGIVDMIVMIENKIYIADVKTSSNVYVSHLIQMGGYHELLSEMTPQYVPEMEIAGYIVIHLPKKGQPRIVMTDECARYRKAFLACLYLYRTNKIEI